MNSDEEIKQAVAKSISYAEIIRRLNRAAVGSNYRWLKRSIARLSLNTSHFKGQSHGTSRRLSKLGKKDLVDSSLISTGNIKRLILRNGLIPYVCKFCNLGPTWNEKPLVLRLDHLNGKRNDHRLENLQFLCPNCDSQTPTFCGRNKVKRI